jgi:hypothetical protein
VVKEPGHVRSVVDDPWVRYPGCKKELHWSIWCDSLCGSSFEIRQPNIRQGESMSGSNSSAAALSKIDGNSRRSIHLIVLQFIFLIMIHTRCIGQLR